MQLTVVFLIVKSWLNNTKYIISRHMDKYEKFQKYKAELEKILDEDCLLFEPNVCEGCHNLERVLKKLLELKSDII